MPNAQLFTRTAASLIATSVVVLSCGNSIDHLVAEKKYYEASKTCEQERDAAEQRACFQKLADAYASDGSLDEAAEYYAKAGLSDQATETYCRAVTTDCIHQYRGVELRKQFKSQQKAQQCYATAAETCAKKQEHMDAGYYYEMASAVDKAKQSFVKAAEGFAKEADEALAELSKASTKVESSAQSTSTAAENELDRLNDQLAKAADELEALVRPVTSRKKARDKLELTARMYKRGGDAENAELYQKKLQALEGTTPGGQGQSPAPATSAAP